MVEAVTSSMRVRVRQPCREIALKTPCLLWEGWKNPDGYGRLYMGAREVLIHRLVWEEAYGPLLPGEQVLHECDNPPCWRLSHLFKGTHLDNMRDRERKGRRGKGSARLTSAQVQDIRSRSYFRGLQSRLSEEFHVTRSTISEIIRHKTWQAPLR